ncbi:hypothetical protein LPJ61_000819 [Coemansia biformis]|uniref:Uncharacterized protein n=1 Tax=Coemansia biformis TaxID=1286918 RepID=A0A9W7YI42_9FUNG|nr:hypothetical protein LPJ61_000819 [Coemansia biformis]
MSIGEKCTKETPKMFSDNDQQRLMKIVPMDQAILGWRDDFGEYLKVITKPGWNMTRKYAESWQNGVQMNYLQKIWTNMTDLGAMRLVERMAKLFVRVKDGLSKDDHE